MNTKEKNNISERKLHIELLRIIAAFFVVFNHAGDRGYLLFYQYEVGQPQFWLYQFFSVLCKVAVPVFFMISGALLIEKEESLSTIWKKRILRMFLVLVFFSLFYYGYKVFIGEAVLSIRQFLAVLYSSSWNGPFWFLYAYISFLITLPLIKPIAKALNGTYFCYLVVLVTLYQGVKPCVEYLCSKNAVILNDNLNISWMLGVTVLYPMLGYYLEYGYKQEEKAVAFLEYHAKKLLMVGWFIVFATVFLSCYMTYYMMVKIPELTNAPQDYVDCFVYLHALLLYFSVKYFCLDNKNVNNYEKHAPRVSQVITKVAKISCKHGLWLVTRVNKKSHNHKTEKEVERNKQAVTDDTNNNVIRNIGIPNYFYKLGKCTFGVFLLHMFILELPISKLIWNRCIVHIAYGKLLFSIVYCLGIYVICILLTLVLRCIPGLKKLL